MSSPSLNVLSSILGNKNEEYVEEDNDNNLFVFRPKIFIKEIIKNFKERLIVKITNTYHI